jgi:hypothetical protein
MFVLHWLHKRFCMRCEQLNMPSYVCVCCLQFQGLLACMQLCEDGKGSQRASDFSSVVQ